VHASKVHSQVPSEGRRLLSVSAILVATFLNLLGFTMSGPITPALGSHFGLVVGASFGALTSAYPLGMLGGLFLWPSLSDRVGRKPVITLSLVGTGLGLAAQAWTVHKKLPLPVFLVCRMLTGALAGAIPIAKAYLADVGTAVGQVPRYMAWRDAAATLSFIVGPYLGGALYAATSESVSAVIGVEALGSLVAALFVASCVVEDGRCRMERARERDPQPAPEARDNTSDDEPVRMEPGASQSCPVGTSMPTAVVIICAVSALLNCGASTFDAFFPSLLKVRLGLNVRAIGAAYTMLASLSFLVSAAVSAPAQRRLGSVVSCAVGLSFISGGLFGLSVILGTGMSLLSAGQILAFWIAVAVYQVGMPLYTPTIPTMLLQCVPKARRGFLMGLDSAINAIARVVAPLLLGAIFQWRGPGACFGAAGASVLIAATIIGFRRTQQ